MSDHSSVDVLIEHARLRLDVDACRRIIEYVAASEKATIGSITVILADHQTVRDLNRQYLRHDFDTDVLSFDYREDPHEDLDGEIFIDLDTARERHEEFGADFEEEAFRYVIHGLLHLIGYSDDNPEQTMKMRVVEDRYLAETKHAWA